MAVTGGPEGWLGDKGWLFGLVFAGLVGAVILGGIHRIAQVTSRLVPSMAIGYLALAWLVIAANAQHLPAAAASIVAGAFTAKGVAGGALGALVVGFQRAVFSNEAGIGSAAIAHAAVRTDRPATEGYVSLLEPLVDTVIICTTSALVVTTTMHAAPGFLENSGREGVAMTSLAFARVFSWSEVPLAIAAVLFAYSTAVSWSYYGLKAWTYLVGDSRLKDMAFKLVYCGFVALGCSVQLGAVLDFSDATVFLVALPNIMGLYLLAPLAKRAVNDYRRDYLAAKRGETVPSQKLARTSPQP
jgi:AGCS family alanine or glycine:cation symporter